MNVAAPAPAAAAAAVQLPAATPDVCTNTPDGGSWARWQQQQHQGCPHMGMSMRWKVPTMALSVA